MYGYCDANGYSLFVIGLQCFGFVQVIVEVVDSETRVLGRKKASDKIRPEAVQQIEVLWKLTQQRIKGDDFWVDRVTNLVYRPVSEGEWPRLHGKLTGTEAVDASYRQKDLFQGLERYMQVRISCLEDGNSLWFSFTNGGSSAVTLTQCIRLSSCTIMSHPGEEVTDGAPI